MNALNQTGVVLHILSTPWKNRRSSSLRHLLSLLCQSCSAQRNSAPAVRRPPLARTAPDARRQRQFAWLFRACFSIYEQRGGTAPAARCARGRSTRFRSCFDRLRGTNTPRELRFVSRLPIHRSILFFAPLVQLTLDGTPSSPAARPASQAFERGRGKPGDAHAVL